MTARRLSPFVLALLFWGCPRATPLPVIPASSLDFRSLHRDALLAQAAYGDTAAVRAALGDPAAPVLVVDLPAVQGRYFLAGDAASGVQVVGVRGTANLKNALLDADAREELDDVSGLRLHEGFLRSSRAVFQDLFLRLDRNRPVRLVGHSLGGAEAVILGLWTQAKGLTVERVVTFGQPQLTNARGGKKAEGLPLLRVVGDKDMVPFMPPAEAIPLLNSFRPFGPEVVLFDGPNYALPASRAPDAARLHSFVEGLRSGTTPPEIQEHLIATYVARLAAKLGAATEVPAP